MEVTLAVVLSLVVGFGAGYFLVKKNVLQEIEEPQGGTGLQVSHKLKKDVYNE